MANWLWGKTKKSGHWRLDVVAYPHELIEELKPGGEIQFEIKRAEH